ncbi:MAG: hypothetical protein ABIK99_02615 [candidate division WOR-3 bacterium]
MTRFFNSLFLFSCLFLVCPPKGVKEFKKAKMEEGRGLKLKEFATALIKTGLFSDYEELAQIPFVFKLTDTLKSPIPSENILLKFNGEIKTFTTDEEGKVILFLSEEICGKSGRVPPTNAGYAEGGKRGLGKLSRTIGDQLSLSK